MCVFEFVCSVCTCGCVCMVMCVDVHVRAYVCMCCECAYLCTRVCVSMYVMYVRLFVTFGICMWVSVRVSGYVHVCVCTCMHMFV